MQTSRSCVESVYKHLRWHRRSITFGMPSNYSSSSHLSNARLLDLTSCTHPTPGTLSELRRCEDHCILSHEIKINGKSSESLRPHTKHISFIAHVPMCSCMHPTGSWADQIRSVAAERHVRTQRGSQMRRHSSLQSIKSRSICLDLSRPGSANDSAVSVQLNRPMTAMCICSLHVCRESLEGGKLTVDVTAGSQWRCIYVPNGRRVKCDDDNL